MSSEYFWGSLQLAGAINPNQEIQLTLEARDAVAYPASDIYVVNGRAYAHIIELINLMASRGLYFYKTAANPDGLIARDDVILIKINEQWEYRGGTNTDVLKELIQAIVDHPDGFVGEIVVADNGQNHGSMDYPQSNAEDITQSTQDVVDMFSPNYNVSTYTWRPIRGTRVDEYSDGNMTDGYILYDTADPETGIYVSYPKFRTQFGTYISFKYGIWNGTGYEKRLKVINMPVLKSHRWYGVTASLKHYMGVQSEGSKGGLANGHEKVATGGMGTLMVETGLPTLNIIDAIWVNANPPPSDLAGPSTPYDQATRVNVLMASTDPVAVDYWAAKHVLMQAASLLGYNDTHTLDPGSTDRSGVFIQAFGVWLDLTKNEIIKGGYNVTTDENHMNVYVYPQTVHDIAVTSIMTSETMVSKGHSLNISVTAQNQGDFNEDFNLTIYANTTAIQTKAVTLPSKNSTTITFTWNATGWAKGNYTISAYATPVPGETETADNMFTDGAVIVMDYPVAYFTYSPINPIVNETVTFNASASYDPDGWIVNYTWNFGDTNTTTVTYPIIAHHYDEFGNYTVTLTVADDDGLTDSISKLIWVGEHPVARFTYSPSHPQVFEEIVFDASDSVPDGGSIVNYTWTFGDSNITTVTDPIITHHYDNYGNYTVILNVTDSEGKWDTESKVIMVREHPHADFSWSPPSPQVSEEVTFNASASTPDGGEIVSYKWDFDDGGKGDGKIVTHTYATFGNFTVTLNVMDNEGKWDIESKNITVIAPPHADFTWWPTNPRVSETVTFDGSLSTPNGGAIVSYEWDFGDGFYDNGVIVCHNYSKVGTYNVTLIATDSEGLNNTAWATVTVLIHNVAVVSVTPSSNEIYAGQIMNITVVVQNNGNFTETFNVTVYANTTIIQTQIVSDLAPGNQTTLIFIWNTTEVSLGNYIIKAEASTVHGETYATDNMKVSGAVNVIPEFTSMPLLIVVILLITMVAMFLRKVLLRSSLSKFTRRKD